MEEELIKKVHDLMGDDKKRRPEKIEALQGIYDYARAEQRTASESMMIDDDGLNDALHEVEKALAELGAPSPAKAAAQSPASL